MLQSAALCLSFELDAVAGVGRSPRQNAPESGEHGAAEAEARSSLVRDRGGVRGTIRRTFRTR